ncbi:hypothetical protein BME96_12635 [Virgibacillus halodenitrificans]|uniref:Uncharacterized protein n=1 Tax=Virgibacillus halodenitrificans TaxID=1482 RepID=A0AAC9NLT8_VIRHA|nr:hypothetical protein [Virgibacillus halodenitrificans]APC48986.1 hypothetical protein BME96_12635 [Virgibacillus halodenitrificans]
MKVEDLIAQGAKVEVSFYCENLKEAEEKLKQYKNFGRIEMESYGITQWLKISYGNIEFIAYYEVGESND